MIIFANLNRNFLLFSFDREATDCECLVDVGSVSTYLVRTLWANQFGNILFSTSRARYACPILICHGTQMTLIIALFFIFFRSVYRSKLISRLFLFTIRHSPSDRANRMHTCQLNVSGELSKFLSTANSCIWSCSLVNIALYSTKHETTQIFYALIYSKCRFVNSW